MPLPRKRQISLSDTPYYHCISRCVRRAFLCGEDKLTGKSYEHRRQWVEDRLLFLTTVFAIEVCAYAVMSNHTHVVLHVNSDKAKHWTDKEVAQRWHKLHKGTLLSHKFTSKQATELIEAELSDAERITLNSTLSVYRSRLIDISWFMRELNEPIARQANQEDNCTGHFWEGRFKSQALLDEHALAACMVYVDLNPIRAKMATTPESSNHTSIKRRIHDFKNGYQPSTLMPFVGNSMQKQSLGLTFDLVDYLKLVDLSGRRINPEQRGAIDMSESPILQRLGFDEHTWQDMFLTFETHFSVAAGQADTLKHYKRKRRQTSTLG
ncbi:transposase [Aliiglaciecola sp. 2_MG-2023]|uniref:transposase n=1 Tax=unclassified Aliiglaciecola TaxID=2593648 RepID=UPI0026E1C05B|nr:MULTISPECIES: transposase [unclassified Aliiglaciecola]MDO6711235.1 transposase [Aliiglaciecola sp. 2_MG-2023]MDO6752149.1 transposase [Aliiglaciecola sp. 1_MG-2023]